MKKILFSLLAIVGLVSSCTNDEIEVESYNDMTYNVSTQSVYEKFGIADDFKKRFLSENWSIGVFTYIYDEEGLLVASDSIHTKTFGKIEQDFTKLDVGKYTAITIEMLVEDEDNFQSDCWFILGQEKQSTLEIANRRIDGKLRFDAYWYNAVGVATTELIIEKGKAITYDITPNPIGVIIKCEMTNFNLSDYKSLDFLTKDQPLGRYLSPKITGDDRFDFKSYNEERTWSPRVYIYINEIDQFEAMHAYLLEEGSLNYSFGAFKKNSDGELDDSFYSHPRTLTVKDGYTYYGGMAFVGGSQPNDYDGIIFDSEDERDQWLDSQQPAAANFVAYPDVTLEWGSNAQTVNTAMNRKTISATSDNTNDDSYILTFMNSDYSTMYDCYFQTNQTNLHKTDIYTYDSASNVLNSLKSNYAYLGYDSDIQGELLSDGITGVIFFSGESVQTIIYLPLTGMSAPQKIKPTIASEPEYVTLPTINREYRCIEPTSRPRTPLYSGKIEQMKKNKDLIERIKSLKEHADVEMK